MPEESSFLLPVEWFPLSGSPRAVAEARCRAVPACLTCSPWLPVQHDDREGEGTDKWVNRGRGRGAFPRGRGRFMFRKSSTSPKWAHDKFSGEEGEIEDDESGTENREEKDALQTTAE